VLGVLRDSAATRTLLVSVTASGAWLGGLEILVTSVASRHGVAALGAIPLAAAAIGGIGVSLVSGTRAVAAVPAVRRYLSGLAISAAVLPLALLADASVAGVTGVLLIVGAAYGLVNAAMFTLVDSASPPGRSVEAFNWLFTGGGAGSAAGAAVTGRLVQATLPGAIVVLVALAYLSAAVAFAQRTTLAGAKTEG
jgi:hypothetical protein